MSRRRTQRSSIPPAQNPRLLLLGALTVALAVAVLLIAMRSAGGLPGESHYDLRVQFGASAAAPVLPAQGSDVRIAGRRVGQTRKAELERGVATLELQLDKDAGPLPADTRAQVRAQGLLGAKYVDLVPGRARATIPDGAILPATRSSIRVTLSDALQAFDAQARPGLRGLLRGLGGGLAGRGGELNAGLEDLAQGLDGFRRAFGPVVDDGTLGPLVSGAESFVAALDPVRNDLARLFDEAGAALEPFAAEGPAVRRLLETAPGALDGTRRSLAATDPVLERAERFARATTSFTAAAPAGLTALTRVLRDGRAPLRSADRVLRDAGGAVAPVLRLTAALDPALPRLRRTLEDARTPARILGDYGCDIARFGQTWRSMIGYAAKGQFGELGPLAILRTTLVISGGTSGVPNPTPGAKVDGRIDPCEPVRGPR
ncbi:MAG TPA: MlaD family protein [Baekduia sp.]|nr:MlaD family protein [Baekduia sp.]